MEDSILHQDSFNNNLSAIFEHIRGDPFIDDWKNGFLFLDAKGHIKLVVWIAHNGTHDDIAFDLEPLAMIALALTRQFINREKKLGCAADACGYKISHSRHDQYAENFCVTIHHDD